MKRFLFAAVFAIATAPALAADVGVSISVGEPGFYGRIDIGNYPQPQVIYTKPIVIQQVPAGVVRQPIYLYVPPGHAKHWDKHCHKYNACGQPVYFVHESWYQNVYVPRYRDERGERDENHGKGHKKEHEKEHKKGHDKGQHDD